MKVTIIGVGAYVASTSDKRKRPYRKGAVIDVDTDVGNRLIADGVAVKGTKASDTTPGDAGTESGPPTATEQLDAFLKTKPNKAGLLERANVAGVTVGDDATNKQIAEALEEAAKAADDASG